MTHAPSAGRQVDLTTATRNESQAVAQVDSWVRVGLRGKVRNGDARGGEAAQMNHLGVQYYHALDDSRGLSPTLADSHRLPSLHTLFEA